MAQRAVSVFLATEVNELSDAPGQDKLCVRCDSIAVVIHDDAMRRCKHQSVGLVHNGRAVGAMVGVRQEGAKHLLFIPHIR